jgi:septal ring factor EnvC (AmiA/AmiB activator)
MNRTEFVIATTIILLLAFVLGWFAYWVMHRFARVQGGDMAEMDRMAQNLHDAEEARDQALYYLEQREEELTNQIAQAEAELRAAMDGLRHARAEVEDLRQQLDRARAAG